ncbi:MocR-like pyridoxine biosynthesis transcription factor PdxR [Enhygromyxa salina]|uniref:2-aminoadipate transaminase n=1 Tax=Enhygromyxa salina TaxID=215803 RepID=A0A2S9YLX3_9BACT|nr:PLP-dependent aminotransferase family protein [Enhygromyxa salina]PRQ06078.1 2-aminoadipate transaminase [Enhygromyxa salina]
MPWDLALTLDPLADKPLYAQIVDGLVAEIRAGRLAPGDRLLGTRRFAAQHGVHRNTAIAAFDELIAEGWLRAEPGSGTRVADELPSQTVARPRRRPSGVPFSLAPHRLAASRAPSSPPCAGLLSLAGGLPDVRLIPDVALARAHRRALRRGGVGLLSYGDSAGHPALRNQLAAMLTATRGLSLGPDDLVVTRGAQMALYLAARVLIQPGDLVAVETWGYPPAWDALRAAGAELVSLPVDGEGLDTAALARLAERRTLRAVYVTPHHQFPTLVTLSAARRLELLELARRHRFAILEDDYDHEVHYQGSPVLPLAHMDTQGSVVYIGTLSKVLAPGLRLGYLVAAPTVLERALSWRRIIDRQGDLSTEAAVAELFEDGEIQRHIGRMRRIYARRRQALLDSLDRHLPGAFAIDLPRGGMALWARAIAGDDTDAWAARGLEHGVDVSPASRYWLGRGRAHGFRLGFAALDERELERAIARLAAAR